MISSNDVKRVGDWGEEIMTQSPNFSDKDCLIHLMEEVGELVRDCGDGSEMADIMLIIMHLAYRKGIDLGKEMESKFQHCVDSEWHYAEDSGRMRRVK